MKTPEASPPRKRGPTAVNSPFRENGAILGDFQEREGLPLA